MFDRMRAPALLANTSYYGTLAAIRSLGRAHIPVVSMDPAAFSPGRYSRYSAGHLRCPPFEQTARWTQWLMSAGQSLAGGVIYATSDAVSYSLAKHRGELSALFLLFQPELETMMCLLDKGQLISHARAVGIETPETWLPDSREEARQIANEIAKQLIVKPRSQLAVGNYAKGRLTKWAPDALMSEFDRMIAIGPHDPDFARDHPATMLPMFQVYHPESADRVYSLSGFRDRSGTRTAVLGAVKVMQRPRRLGVGLCFEEMPVDAALAAKVFALCERIGYFGAFECEFIQTGDQYLLIDFNARFYNQLGFDIARGLDLPNLVYAAATGQESKVDELIGAFNQRDVDCSYAFCNGFQFALITRVRQGLGSMSREEGRRWRNWQTFPGRTMVDATFDADDRVPYAADAACQLFSSLRHPRAFINECRVADVA